MGLRGNRRTWRWAGRVSPPVTVHDSRDGFHSPRGMQGEAKRPCQAHRQAKPLGLSLSGAQLARQTDDDWANDRIWTRDGGVTAAGGLRLRRRPPATERRRRCGQAGREHRRRQDGSLPDGLTEEQSATIMATGLRDDVPGLE